MCMYARVCVPQGGEVVKTPLFDDLIKLMKVRAHSHQSQRPREGACTVFP
jgi:hypothetical protein